MLRTPLRRTCLALILSAACSTAADWSAPPREALRTDVLGCWRLAGMQDEPTPALIRLDSNTVRFDGSAGQRAVRRLDERGRTILKDGEGLPFVDRWTADSSSDSIRLHLAANPAFFGSNWVLAYPLPRVRSDSLRGRSLAFTDVVLDSPYPIRSVTAVRVDCPIAKDSI